MANYQTHFSFSLVIAIVYGALGLYLFHIYPEQILLGATVVVIAGMLPDIDHGDSAPSRELAGLLGVIAPLLILERYPSLKAGGVARVALIVVCVYALVRILVARFLQKHTTHRGMIHSIPAAIITFQLVYLLFWDMFWYDRLFVAFGAFLGFLSHLLIDAYSNVDIVGTATGNKKPAAPVLKFFAKSTGLTVSLYGCVLILGWFMVSDMYPHAKLFAGVNL